MPGQAIRVKSGGRVTFPVDVRLNPGSVVRIITREGQTMEQTADDDTCHLDVEMRIESSDFMRVEAWEYMEEYDRSMLTLLSNPVYILCEP